MTDMNDAKRLARAVKMLEKVKDGLHKLLSETQGECDAAKARGDFANYETLTYIKGDLHDALAGAERACARSFGLETDQVSPRTGGGGK